MLSGSQMVGALPALLSCGLAALFRMLPCGVVLVLGGFQVGQMQSEHDVRLSRGSPLGDAWRPHDDVWQLVHSVAPPVRDARES